MNKGEIRRFWWKVRDKEWPLKLKMLLLYRGNFRDWYRDVWRQEPWEQQCCSGLMYGCMCGCMGSCYAHMWEHVWKTRRAAALRALAKGEG